MAGIPTYEQRTLASGVPQVQAAPPNMAGAILQNAGAAESDYADSDASAQHIIDRKKQQDDAAWAGNQLATSKVDLSEKMQTLQDNAAPGAPGFHDAWNKTFKEYSDQAVKDAPSPDAANYLQQKLTQYQAQLAPEAMRFEVGSRTALRIGNAKSAVDTSRNQANSHPDQFPQLLGDSLAMINALDVPEKDRQALIQQTTQGLSKSALLGMADNNPSDTITQLDSGKWDKFVDPDARAQIVSYSKQVIHAQVAEAKQQAALAKAQAQADIAATFQDTVQSAQLSGKGNPEAESQILRAYPGKVGINMVRQIDVAAATGNDKKIIASQPMSADSSYLLSLTPQPGEGSYLQTQRYQAASDAIAQKEKALTTDGATYVMQTNPGVQQAWTSIGQGLDPNLPADQKSAAIQKQQQSALQLTMQAQRDLGVPENLIKRLPASQASLIADTINKANPKQVGDAVDSAVASFGNDALPQIVQAGASPTTMAIAFANEPGQQQWREKLVTASQIKPADLDKQMALANIKQKDLDKQIGETMAPLLKTIPTGSRQSYVDAVETVAKYNIGAFGMTAGQAVTDAYSAFNNKYSFSDSYRVPSAYPMPSVQAGLSHTVQSIGTMDLDASNFFPNPNAATKDPAYQKEQLVNSLQAGHFKWITNKDETGVALFSDTGLPVMMKDHRQVVVPFSAAVTIGSETRHRQTGARGSLQ